MVKSLDNTFDKYMAAFLPIKHEPNKGKTCELIKDSFDSSFGDVHALSCNSTKENTATGQPSQIEEMCLKTNKQK